MFRPIFKMLSVVTIAVVFSSLFSACGSDSDSSPKLVDMQITPASTYVVIGQGEQFVANGIYDDGSTSNITGSVNWRSTNTSIATINASGIAYGVSAGDTQVIASYNVDGVKLIASAKLNVSNKEVLDPANPTLKSVLISGNSSVSIGKTTQLTAIATLTDGTTFTVNDKANWSSSDTSVVTVDANGLVTGNSEGGSAVITARGKKNSSIVATHTINVVSTEITLDKIQIELGYNEAGGQIITSLNIEVGTEVYVTAWGIYSNGERRYINTEVVWWSDNQQVATIVAGPNGSSNIYGKDIGSAIVTAKLDGKEASLNVAVVINETLTLESIEINANGADVTNGDISVDVGGEQWLTAYGHYSDGTRSDINSKVFYSSSNSDIAYVNDNKDSNVKGRAPGTAVISVDWQGVHSQVTANVSGAEGIPTLEDIEIQDQSGAVITSLTLGIGKEEYISAYGIYSDGSREYINTEVVWFSDNNDVAKMDILQRDSWVTGVSVGSAKISAKKDGKIEYLYVNVK